MKKSLLIMSAILIVLGVFFTVPAAPVAAKSGANSLTLIYAQYIPNKGVTFKFKVHGNFEAFSGFAVINGHEYPLSCKSNENEMLSCTASQGLQTYIGEIATITLNGYQFIAIIRGSADSFCYPVFDLVNLEGAGSSELTFFEEKTPWEQAGTYCQEILANVGDEIYWYNPAWVPPARPIRRWYSPMACCCICTPTVWCAVAI